MLQEDPTITTGVGTLGAMKSSTLAKTGVVLAGLYGTYLFTNRDEPTEAKDYPLPATIKVKDTDLPTRLVENPNDPAHPDTVIDTEAIDFSKEFFIKTDRYTYTKEEDFILSRALGHIFSIPSKIFFFDWDIGNGLDKEEARAVLSMVENNPKLDGVCVRVNHNAVFEDCMRLFTDPEVVERNGFAARAFIGLPQTFFGELFAELRRGDYYNPMTHSSVLYSNVTSIAAHELGHHQDFRRFDRDWAYAVARSIPPVMLYQEWQASTNAKDQILSPKEQWQYDRYLLPAFATYLLASYYISKKILAKKDNQVDSEGNALKNNTIKPEQSLRHMATQNAGLHAGIAAYGMVMANGSPPLLAAAAFIGAWYAVNTGANFVMKDVIPYEHEK